MGSIVVANPNAEITLFFASSLLKPWSMIAVTKVDNGLTTEEFTSVWYLPVKLVSIVGSYPPVIIILPSLASNKLLLLRSNTDNSDGVNCKEKLPDASVIIVRSKSCSPSNPPTSAFPSNRTVDPVKYPSIALPFKVNAKSSTIKFKVAFAIFPAASLTE